MLLQLLSAAVVITAARAQWASTSTEYDDTLSCATEYGSTWVAPIPTTYSRFTTTISSIAPEETYTSTVYVTANTTVATPITLYANIYTTSTLLLDVTTKTITSTLSTTIATMTSATTVCTNAVIPSSTVTSYSGSYTPIPGQSTVLPSTYEALDSCTVSNTEIQHIFPTTVGPTVTSTIPFSTASPTVWTTQTYTFTTTQYRSTATVSAAAFSFGVGVSTATVSTACSPTQTVTFAAQCAPQNLIAEMDGYGLSVGTFNRNFTFGGVADTAQGDPSLCCQLCVENEGCVASVYWAQSSSCLLGYVGGEDRCPVAFDYHAVNYTEVPTKPRQGNIFQTGAGCGSITYAGVDRGT